MLIVAIVGYVVCAAFVVGARKLFRGPGRRIGFWIFIALGAVVGLCSTAVAAFSIDLLIHPLVW